MRIQTIKYNIKILKQQYVMQYHVYLKKNMDENDTLSE